MPDYVAALERELATAPGHPFARLEIYLGGGTRACPRLIARLLRFVAATFDVAPAQVTLGQSSQH